MNERERERGIHVGGSLAGKLAVKYDDPPSGARRVLGAREKLLQERVSAPDVQSSWNVTSLVLVGVPAVQDEVLVHQICTLPVTPHQLCQLCREANMEMMNTHRDTTTMYEQCKRVKAMS